VADESEADRPAVASGFPVESNPRVEGWITFFTSQDRDRFQRFINRGQTYRKVIEDLLRESDLPVELYYLALIESGYQNHAVSSAKATGVWQFMPATARRYGLQVDRYVDERRDPIRSTEAAAKYLRDLYNIFGSWPLAIAAYNAGEYRIINAILKAKTRDFWTLAEMGALPKETTEYVPKIMAAILIASDPERYGVIEGEGEAYPELEAVEIASPVLLTDVARAAGMGLEDLRAVNPHLQNGYTPKNADKYEIWIPEARVAILKQSLGSLAALAKKFESPSRTPAARKAKAKRNYHLVRAGENLTVIARRYSTTAAYLMRVNALRSSQISPGMELRVTSKIYRPERQVRYRVRRGESLERIARRFDTTVMRLKDDNDLRTSKIFPGKVLLIKRNGQQL
jgi:membrane-bound lytic murein transglycosylase D